MRPVRSLAGAPTRFQDVDLIIVRENTEGLYSGVENQVTDDVVMSMKVATETVIRPYHHHSAPTTVIRPPTPSSRACPGIRKKG